VADVAVVDDRSDDGAVEGGAPLQIDGATLPAVQPIEDEAEPVVAAPKAAPMALKTVGDAVPPLRLAMRSPEAATSASETAPASNGILKVVSKESRPTPTLKIVLEKSRLTLAPSPTPRAVPEKLQGPQPALRAAPEEPQSTLRTVPDEPREPQPTPQTVPEEPQPAPAAAPEVTTSKPFFSLRVKTKSAASATGAATSSSGSAASAPAPSEWVRPKPDQRTLYYQLMDGLYDAILILDDQGHVVDVSRRVTEILGYSREETWDMSIGKLIPGMSRQMFEHLRRNLKDKHQVLIDARCFRKDGTSFAGEIGVSTLTLTRASNMVFAIRNVERRKNVMDEMRRGQAAFELSFSPCFVCDIDGFFQVVNPALLEAFGIPDVGQAKRVRFVDLLPDAASLFLRAVCGDEVRETLNVSVANGMAVALELALAPLKSGQTVTGVAGSMRQPG